MPHGTPDWGLVGPKATTYGLDDLGEHAVRLGTPHLWDRRGDVVWMSDFREGLGDVLAFVGVGAGGSVVLHTEYARQGAYCVKLTTDDVDEFAQLTKHFPFPVLSLLGLEATFGCEPSTAYMELYAFVRDAADTWRPTLRWDPNAGTIQLQTGVAVFHTLAPAQRAFVTPSCCNTVKVVFDITTGFYVRVIANEQVYSAAGVPIYRTAGAVPSHFLTRVEHHADDGKNAIAYVDNWIITQNEP